LVRIATREKTAAGRYRKRASTQPFSGFESGCWVNASTKWKIRTAANGQSELILSQKKKPI